MSTPAPLPRRPAAPRGAVVSAACLAAAAALGAWAAGPPADAARGGPPAVALAPPAPVPIDPEAFLAHIAPTPPPLLVPQSREDAIANELMVKGPLIGAREAVRAAHALVVAARREGLDPLLFLAVISVESGFDPLARSAVGAEGLMQLMPRTAVALARRERMAWGAKSGYDPVANVRLGVRYIAELERRFHRRLDLALTAYNRGPAATWRLLAADGQLPPRVHAFYAGRVIARLGQLRARYGRLSWAPSSLF